MTDEITGDDLNFAGEDIESDVVVFTGVMFVAEEEDGEAGELTA